MANGLSKTDSHLAARCAAVASIGAAVVHFGVAPMHWRDWALSGVFFAAIAVFQVVWAFRAWLRPSPPVLATGMLVNIGSAALWVTSRTVGAPLGPFAGRPEAVDAAGICVLLLQSYVIMGSAWAWHRRNRVDEVPGLGRALVLLGANTVMAVAVTVGLASSMQGHDHHGGNEVHAEHQVTPVAPSAIPTPAPSGVPATEASLQTDGHHHGHHD